MNTFAKDTSKNDFIKAWPGGYEENFKFHPDGTESMVAGAIAKFSNKNHTCIEIGPGRGLWTKKYLAPSFKRVVCIDVIPRPEALDLDCVEWIEVGDRDFSCSGVESSSIDFAFSFGVFCHLSQSACQAYLHSLFRVLKQGAHALLMFANWKRHPGFNQDPSPQRFANERHTDGTCWFYCDLDMTRQMTLDAGFSNFVDVYPDFRDTICSIDKTL